MKVILPAIKTPRSDWDKLERKLRELFRKAIFEKIEKSRAARVHNAPSDPVAWGLNQGRISFLRGKFTGRFSAAISKRLRELGAEWDGDGWRIQFSYLPNNVRQAVFASDQAFEREINRIREKLSEINPKEVASQINSAPFFDRAIWKAEKSFYKNANKIAVVPELSASDRKAIARGWSGNMDLWIQSWTEKAIKDLRQELMPEIFSGNRIEDLEKIIKRHKNVSDRKARFLARQETHLLMSAYKKNRYQDLGSKEYIWTCVHMPFDKTKDHHTLGNVRYFHGLLNKTIQKWDEPPETDRYGHHNHPGEDYNCRCIARPIVEF